MANGNITGEIDATVEYKWTINRNCIIGKSVGEFVKSPIFKTVFNTGESHYWELILYPKGAKEEYSNFLSVYLRTLNNKEVKIRLSIKIVCNENYVIISRSTCKEHVLNACYPSSGFSKCVRLDIVEKTAKDNSKLTFICGITAGELKNEEQHVKYQRLSSDLEQLVDDQEFSDVEFTLGDRKLRAHKSILSKRSPVFAAMFRSDMREKHENEVKVPDVEYEIFREMLRYIYAEKVNGIEEMTDKLLVVADKYALDGLKLMCEERLIGDLNDKNVFKHLRLADRHNIENLKNISINFIVTKGAAIVKSPEFRELPANILADVCSALTDKIK